MRKYITANDFLEITSPSTGEKVSITFPTKDKKNDVKTVTAYLSSDPILTPDENYGSDGSDSTQSTAKDELLKTIEEITAKYQSASGKTQDGVTIPELKEKEFTMPTKEDIVKIVSEQIVPVYDAERQSLKDENEDLTKALNKQVDEIERLANETYYGIKRDYSTARESASNEALKRGLGRSSIILNQLDDLGKSELSAIEDATAKRDEKLADINEEIKTLTSRLANALGTLDAKQAAELAKGIRELTDEYEKKQEEVLEYNNKIREKQAEINKNYANENSGTVDTESEEYIEMISSKTKAFYSYYYALGENAKSEIEKDKDMIISEIGENGYNNLKSYFN